MFNDDNTIEDIQGVIYCLQSDIYKDDPEFFLEDQFSDLLERINDKISRNRNEIRAKWFGEALNQAKIASKSFTEGRSEEAALALRKCLDGMTDGNKAHRRKTNFIVAPDGTATQARKQPRDR